MPDRALKSRFVDTAFGIVGCVTAVLQIALSIESAAENQLVIVKSTVTRRFISSVERAKDVARIRACMYFYMEDGITNSDPLAVLCVQRCMMDFWRV